MNHAVSSAGELEDSPEIFAGLWKYIEDDNITDIDYNGQDLWLRDCENKKYQAQDVEITKEFIRHFTQRIANSVSKEFNGMNPVLEAESRRLRISIVHEAVAVSGRSICIRKTLPIARINRESAIAEGYASADMLDMIEGLVQAHMNIVVCGKPAAGKTELTKYISMAIPNHERVITIEDNMEWRYKSIKPQSDCIELQVSERFPYEDAIRACLRQNPDWMMVSEIRGREASQWMEGLTTGVNSITSLHTNDVRDIPDRICNMTSETVMRDRMEEDIYTFLNVGILVSRRKDTQTQELRRYVDQLCFFFRSGGKNHIHMVFNSGRLVSREFPEEVVRLYEKASVPLPSFVKANSFMQKPEAGQEPAPELEGGKVW